MFNTDKNLKVPEKKKKRAVVNGVKAKDELIIWTMEKVRKLLTSRLQNNYCAGVYVLMDALGAEMCAISKRQLPEKMWQSPKLRPILNDSFYLNRADIAASCAVVEERMSNGKF